MPKNREANRSDGDERWAHFRFSVIGPLLAAPPRRGELKGELQRLGAKNWRHPISGEWVRFGLSTIERWYYRAVSEASDPVGVLSRKIREDRGRFKSLSRELREKLFAQYRSHPSWSYQLHHDNLVALATLDTPASIQQLRALCRMRTATLCETLNQLCESQLVSQGLGGYRFIGSRDPLPVSVSLSPIENQGNGNGKPQPPDSPPSSQISLFGKTDAGTAGTQPAEG